MHEQIWLTIVSEFSDIPDINSITRVIVRLTMATILGAIIGYERERRFKSAGIRTHMLVCIGTAMFIIGPMQAGVPITDMSRILQGVVQGIGFLGAGAIVVGTLRQRTQGLTSAASIWATAAIGMAAGLGMEVTAILATVFVIFILAVVPVLIPNIKPVEAIVDSKTENKKKSKRLS